MMTMPREVVSAMHKSQLVTALENILYVDSERGGPSEGGLGLVRKFSQELLTVLMGLV
jgi:hypothetical protein